MSLISLQKVPEKGGWFKAFNVEAKDIALVEEIEINNQYSLRVYFETGTKPDQIYPEGITVKNPAGHDLIKEINEKKSDATLSLK